MTTSISSEAFEKKTQKVKEGKIIQKNVFFLFFFIEKMLIYERNVIRKFQYSNFIMGEENHVFNVFIFLPIVA